MLGLDSVPSTELGRATRTGLGPDAPITPPRKLEGDSERVQGSRVWKFGRVSAQGAKTSAENRFRKTSSSRRGDGEPGLGGGPRAGWISPTCTLNPSTLSRYNVQIQQ